MTTTYKIKDTHRFLDVAPAAREYVLAVRDLPLEKKPREKLIAQGPGVLSLAELVAVIFTTGTKTEDVLEMANRIIREYGEKSIVTSLDAAELAKAFEIPLVKACQIVATGELGRRFFQKSESGLAVLRTAKDVYEYLRDMRTLSKEHLRGLYLNSHHRVIHDEIISIGTIDSNIIHPREVFRPAIAYGAVAVILAHNHPSNIAIPSDEDITITKDLIEAGNLIGIHVIDHIIITEQTFTSIEADYL